MFQLPNAFFRGQLFFLSRFSVVVYPFVYEAAVPLGLFIDGIADAVYAAFSKNDRVYLDVLENLPGCFSSGMFVVEHPFEFFCESDGTLAD